MKKSITQKYPAKAESILSSCFVIKPATNNKLEYCEAKDVLWDTGATNTIISRNIADALGLEPIQKAMIAGIGGNVEAYTYKISLYFAKEGAWIKDLEVLACDLEDNDIIIGSMWRQLFIRFKECRWRNRFWKSIQDRYLPAVRA